MNEEQPEIERLKTRVRELEAEVNTLRSNMEDKNYKIDQLNAKLYRYKQPSNLRMSRGTLDTLTNWRLEDAKRLYENKRFHSSVYVGGYAVECALKYAVCRSKNQ
ncbi:MAG: hypothetical protein NUW37_07865 [Planctomycetes bacterium]|nr:hypothetical protein [Planctomycetota bacterium]